MIRYLHLDCEMGGRDLQYSLLTAYFMVTDDAFNVLGELSLAVKPDDGVYIVSGQGMRVNGINLQQHDEIAIPYKQAKPLLYNFLQTHGKTTRLTPVGHGVRGDIDFLIKYLTSMGTWEQFCTYHYIDTSIVLQFLRACGKMPVDTDGSVKALAEHFGCGILPARLHEADYDTKLTANVFRHMIEIGKR